MNDATDTTVTTWPGVARLREEFAELTRRTAWKRQTDCGWSTEETCRQVLAAAAEAAEIIAEALVAAAEMSLDTWAATR